MRCYNGFGLYTIHKLSYQSAPIELGPKPGVSIRDRTSLDLLCFNNIVSICDSLRHWKGPTVGDSLVTKHWKGPTVGDSLVTEA